MMRRIVLCLAVLLLAIPTLLGSDLSPALGVAMAQDAATPVADAEPPAERCTREEFSGFLEVQEFPIGWDSWMVVPLENVDERILYFVTVTLEPGKCIPFRSGANQKDGAVILIVHRGNIAFVAEEHEDVPGATVKHGMLDALGAGTSTDVAFGTEVQVGPDEWISQDAQVWFTFWNTSDTEDVEIWKVVWAPPSEKEGCGGDCK